VRVALMLEDSREANLIRDWLKDDGHLPSSYFCAFALISALRKDPFDVVFADWSSVSMATSLLLKEVRGPVASEFALVFVSSLKTETPIVRALQGGAAGYITRPFGRRELLARLAAIVRRDRLRRCETRDRIIDCAGLKVDCIGREIWRDGRAIQLTAKDFDLGLLFLENVGRLLLRGQIQRSVWGLSAPFGVSNPGYARSSSPDSSWLNATTWLAPHGNQRVWISPGSHNRGLRRPSAPKRRQFAAQSPRPCYERALDPR
jgi:DNA-binding response OmpR family regulator